MAELRSNYKMELIDLKDRLIKIIDLDGPRSVTNDAERVVAELNKRFPNYRILYQDTMGNWDELLHIHGIFTGFAPGPNSTVD